MTRFLRRSALVGVALVSVACTYVRATPLGADSYPAISPDSVRLFATNAPSKYVEIAMMKVEGVMSNDRKSARALREKAAKMGANGIILLNARAVATHGGTNVGIVLGGSKSGTSTVIVGDEDHEVHEFERAVAIRYEPEPAVAQASGGATPR